MVPVLKYSWPLYVRDYNGLGPQRTVLVSLFKLYHLKKKRICKRCLARRGVRGQRSGGLGPRSGVRAVSKEYTFTPKGVGQLV